MNKEHKINCLVPGEHLARNIWQIALHNIRDFKLLSPDNEQSTEQSDRADYCLDCSFLSQCKHRVLVFTLEWSGARPMGEQW